MPFCTMKVQLVKSFHVLYAKKSFLGLIKWNNILNKLMKDLIRMQQKMLGVTLTMLKGSLPHRHRLTRWIQYLLALFLQQTISILCHPRPIFQWTLLHLQMPQRLSKLRQQLQQWLLEFLRPLLVCLSIPFLIWAILDVQKGKLEVSKTLPEITDYKK